MTRWPESLSGLIAQEIPSILVTIVEAKGSVPRGAGTKMIVTDQGLHYGTIGGGNLEYQCIGVAKQRLSGADWQRKVQRFPLGASLGQCCGGVVIVLFEYIGTGQQVWLSDVLKHKAARQTVLLTTSLNHQTAAKQVALASAPSAVGLAEQTPDYLVETVKSNDFNIVVFGAGHVGRALVNVLAGLECEVTWVDSRAEEFPETIPANVIKAVEPNPEDVVETAPVDSYFVVLTHSHSLDQLLCERILTRSDFRYCGLIGSLSKRAKFEHRLHAKGFSEQQIATLTCPMGIPSLGGKQPGHIAVAVAAQLLEQQASY